MELTGIEEVARIRIQRISEAHAGFLMNNFNCLDKPFQILAGVTGANQFLGVECVRLWTVFRLLCKVLWLNSMRDARIGTHDGSCKMREVIAISFSSLTSVAATAGP